MKRIATPAMLTFGLLAILLFPAAGSGQEFVGGWEGGTTRGYGFGMPVFSKELGGGNFLVVRGSGSFLYYKIPDATGDTRVRSPGISGGLAYRFRTPRLSLTIGPGYEVRWKRSRLSDGSELRETERGINAQGDIFFQATPLTNLNLIASYGDANRYVWSRAGVKRQVTNTKFERSTALALGLELTAQGNREIRAYQAGGLFEIMFLRARGSIQLRAGYAQERYPSGLRFDRPYFSIGLYKAFR
jgi:hypothetical protein